MECMDNVEDIDTNVEHYTCVKESEIENAEDVVKNKKRKRKTKNPTFCHE